MDSKIEKIIEKIVHIPHDFNNRGNISEIDLTKESGYFEQHERINEYEIMQVLKNNPHLIVEWIQLSEDKRSTPTWHFVKFDDGECIVDYSGTEAEFKEINTFDEFEACAAFIKREVESNRKFSKH
jgi:hypothetical protein